MDHRNPVRIAICIGITVAAAAMVFAGMRAARGCEDPIWYAAIGNAPMLFLAVALVGCGRLRRSGITAPLCIAALPFLWLPVLHLLYVLRFVGPGEMRMVLGIVVHSILLALWEEAVFRGVILDILLPAGTARATTISALLFGLLHFMRVLDGMPVSDTLLLVAFSFSFGVLAGGLRLRLRSLWPVILWHAALDIAGGLPPGPMTSILPAIGGLPVELYLFAITFVAYGLFLAGWRKRAMLLSLVCTSALLGSLVVADLD